MFVLEGRAKTRVAASVVLTLLTLMAQAAPAYAHDPPAGDNPLVHLLVDHVLQLIPGPLFALALGAIGIATLLLCLWLRGAPGLFTDRTE